MPNKPLFITGLDTRDFKRIKAVKVQLKPEGGLITIGGANANGKSSLLDAIQATLDAIPRDLTRPVRDGAAGAGCRIEIPPYQVTRTFDENGKPALKVTYIADGAEIKSPATFLKNLLGGVFIDPLEFFEMQPREKRKLLQDVIGLDLSEHDEQIEQLRKEVKEKEFYQLKLKNQVEDLEFDESAPEHEISISALTEELNEVTRANTASSTLRQQAEFAKAEIARCEQEIKRLQLQIESQKDVLNQHIPAEKPTDELRQQIADAENINRKVRNNQARVKAIAEWKEAEKEVGLADAKLKQLQVDKKELLASAKFPVPGLGFDAEGVTLNDLPFEQASQAEQIRAAVAIALARGGDLRPILIRNASNLDAKSLALISEIAVENDAQVFAEIVANETEEGFDKDCSFYIVDGEIKVSA